MNWKDIEVGDIISIQARSERNLPITSGEITQIRHYNRATDTNLDPIAYYISDDYYEFRLKAQTKYGLKEYALNSLFWRLINIQKKGEISTMPLEIGKKYKVNIPQDWQNPGQQEFTGRLVEINLHNSLTHLVYSKQLEENENGHSGSDYTQHYGCWWCDPKWLTPLEPELTKETIKLEDILNE